MNGVNRGKRSEKRNAGRCSNTGKADSGSEAQERFKKKRERRIIPHGVVYVAASFNNTQISITDTDASSVLVLRGAIASRDRARHAVRRAAASLAAAGVARDQYG